MPDYAALVAAWNQLPQPVSDTDSATVIANLATLNNRTVTGPNIDVPTSAVIGVLALDGSLLTLEEYAASPPNGSNPAAVASAKLLSQIALGQSPIEVFRMSDPDTATKITDMLSVLTSDSNSGIDAAHGTAILALAHTTEPWRSAAVANGGAGLSASLLNSWDLVNAGVISISLAELVESA